MFEIKIERINANEDELLLTEILVNIGDSVKVDQEVAVVETTKSSVTIASKFEGVVKNIKSVVGEMVEVGATLIVLSNDDDSLINDNFDVIPELNKTNSNQNAKSRLLNKKNKININKKIDSSFINSPIQKDIEEIHWIINAKHKIESNKNQNNKFSTQDLRRLYPNSIFEENINIVAESIFIEDNIIIKNSVNIVADKIYIGSGVSIGKGCNITTGELIILDGSTIAEDVIVDLAGGKTPQSKLFIGPLCLVGSRVMINTCRSVIIDEESAISPGAMIFTHSFWQSRLDGYQNKFAPVYIGPKSWVGAGCQILPGINIGVGSIVVSNSTVVDNVQSKTMVAGVPAIEIKKNLTPINDLAQKKSILIKIIKEFIFYLNEKKIETSTSDDVFIVNIENQQYYLIVETENHKIEVDERNTILLTFRCQENKIGNYFAIFDLISLAFYGNENSLVHTLRNHLRRNGVRFSPYSWRPNYLKEL
jgi:acetyltransferase-like isoleucine patch superfamily enzyme